MASLCTGITRLYKEGNFILLNSCNLFFFFSKGKVKQITKAKILEATSVP